MNGRDFDAVGAGPRCCLGSADGNFAGVLGAAVAGDCAVGSGGCVGCPPTCEDDKDAIPTHTPRTMTAVVEPLMTFSRSYERSRCAVITLRKFHWLAAALRRIGCEPYRQNPGLCRQDCCEFPLHCWVRRANRCPLPGPLQSTKRWSYP